MEKEDCSNFINGMKMPVHWKKKMQEDWEFFGGKSRCIRPIVRQMK